MSAGNTFGHIFRLTTYGESHGPGLGGIVDGCPAGIALCEADMQKALDERRPGAGGKGGVAGTTRNEPDAVRIVSGVFEGKTTGTPIAFHVENVNQHSTDYTPLSKLFRPGHADLGFHCKYGARDYRGGGRSSGRETVSRVAGGAVAAQFLATQGIHITACTMEFGGIPAALRDVPGSAQREFFSPDAAVIPAWKARATQARSEGDTLGGLVRIEILGLPAGLGEPVFDKLDARLAYAFMGVGAVKGVEIGAGFASARLTGSEHNDAMHPASAGIGVSVPAGGALDGGAEYVFSSNNAGGILGGMSSGAPVIATVAVKPIASIAKEQQTITLDGETTTVRVGGRHDICAIPRIVPVLKAMAALSVADFILLQRSARV